MMLKKIVAGGAVAAGLLLAAGPATAAGGNKPQGVVILNNTRFEPFAHNAVIPAGESARFEIRSDGFGRASVLIAGLTAPEAGDVNIVALFGPPLVPVASPRALQSGSDGVIHDRLITPVLGPIMVVVVSNDSSAPVTLTMSAYLAD